ncbi:MAG: hypothetical protein HRT90_07415 [Candidatus Margulisbacteria bacterium]|nr:hypothetical protein [Candidatus Margulisiibacteriota bacterium]
MMKWILYIVVSGCVISNSLIAEVPYQLVKGVITSPVTWNAPMILVGDVVVSENVTLTIGPDAWVIFNDNDINNLGYDSLKPELLVYGKLKTDPDFDTVRFVSIQDRSVQDLLSKSGLQSVDVHANAFDTKRLSDSFRGFKHQYKVLWSLAFALHFIFLK